MADIEILRSVLSKSTKLNEADLYKPSCFHNLPGTNSDSLFVVKSTDTLKFKEAFICNDEVSRSYNAQQVSNRMS